MAKQTTNKKQLIFDINDDALKELTAIAQRVGFDGPEELIKNYLREVLLAARIEMATSQLRDTVIRGSTDLDSYKPKRSIN